MKSLHQALLQLDDLTPYFTLHGLDYGSGLTQLTLTSTAPFLTL
uniref:Uncharacterized protein n=1 Tax=viral metagenome TaxID=1070528 RepID=A0A6C0JY17_9ZZZZ